ncbi:MAG: hypothetical protein UR27_C0010G0055 [Candidatus Peregrinibacteria bacterium GW2011_GWA2_33_10]|nr:MAG: hypothetical protein UR27_C0010G0055 [Candidatus Peregrinibacteria bacterium GW2011_GWA2_33_10]KKP41243.1 MAG: hypothetical protein UR30_C0001G0090 [Candidatus Peregrinibacteria bacterium GW2011_GWC2_33_13]OGJ50339.1 MAG: hypothetical protein A2229_02565 [Candidatus Peregrinibacteria bacterium RIFOXYA2_FULL_33_7]
MHICHVLQQGLEEQKKLLDEIKELRGQIEDIETVSEFMNKKIEAERRLVEIVDGLTVLQKECEGRKLNFKEELLQYLGGKEKDWEFGFDEDGYVVKIRRADAHYEVPLKNINLNFLFLDHLESLDLSNTNLNSVNFNKNNVSNLNLDNTNVFFPFFDLGQFRNMEFLNLSYAKVDKLILNNNNNKLKSLVLYGCKLKEEVLDVSEILNLEILDISETYVKDVKFENPNLKELYMENTKLSRKKLDISELYNLVRINIEGSDISELYISKDQEKKIKDKKLQISVSESQSLIS